MRQLAVLVAAVALVAVACAGAPEPGSEIQPFEELAVAAPVFGYDEAGRFVMTVDTTAEAVCAIAWGPTDELGNLGTDLDMAGGGHARHRVILAGAEPGRAYSYRLQGVTADGTLYQSAVATFTVPEPPGGAGGGADNLAVGAAVVEVSSEFSTSWAAGNAFDGDLATEWATAGDGDAAFVTVDLGRDVAVGGFEFITRSMSDGTSITTRYTVSVDGGEPLGPFPAGGLDDPATATVSVTGRVFRFDVASSTGGNTGAVEIRILPAEE